MSETSHANSAIASPVHSPPFHHSNSELVTLRVDLASASDHRAALSVFSRSLRPAAVEAAHCVRLRERFDIAIQGLQREETRSHSIPMVFYAAEVVTLVLAHFEAAACHLDGACPRRAAQFEARGYALLRVVAIHAPVMFSQLAGRVS